MLKEILQLIKNYQNVVIFGHKNPDEDCYGAQVALKEAISLKYPSKNIYIVGSGVPKFFEILSPMDIVGDEIIKDSLAIIVDSNDLERIEDTRVYTAKSFCKIDHHIDNGTFKEGPSIVNDRANSVCDIITGLLIENKFEINKKIANALYLGILTDSGRFQFVTNHAETYSRVSYLCRCGAEPNEINKILNKTSEQILKAKNFIFKNYKKTNDGVLYLLVRSKTIAKLGLNERDFYSLINSLSNVEGYPIWAFFIETKDKKCKVEVRSNGPAINDILARVGGGGHMFAAGTIFDSFDMKKINKFLNDLNDIVIKWK